MRKQRNVQKNRKRILERGCYLSDDRITHSNMATDPRRNIIVDDKHQILYCFVPKIACTSWKIVFLQLSGIVPPGRTPSQYYVNRHGLKKLRLLREYDLQQRRYILGHYRKFLFTRNPYTRLLSVYRNKLEPESTFERAQKWQDTVGKVITDKYGPKKKTAATSSVPGQNATLTFTKFLRYIIDDTSAVDDNRHWRSVYDSCFPCDVNYDFIGRFETLHSDVAYFLNLLGVEGKVEFPKAEMSSPTNSSNTAVLRKYYSKVPPILMKKLYAKYRLDFHLFGYREM